MFWEAVGRAVAETLAPYPPGIPLVAGDCLAFLVSEGKGLLLSSRFPALHLGALRRSLSRRPPPRSYLHKHGRHVFPPRRFPHVLTFSRPRFPSEQVLTEAAAAALRVAAASGGVTVAGASDPSLETIVVFL